MSDSGVMVMAFAYLHGELILPTILIGSLVIALLVLMIRTLFKR